MFFFVLFVLNLLFKVNNVELLDIVLKTIITKNPPPISPFSYNLVQFLFK